MRAETLILGGGIAGLSIARALARSTDRDGGSGVMLLEAEASFGVHSSGLNAAILRSAIDAPATRALALATADELRSPPDDLAGTSFVDDRGLVLLEGSAEAPAPRWLADHQARGAIESLSLDQVAERLPGFVPEGSRAWWLPGGGRIDTQRLLLALAESASNRGVQLRTGARAERIVCAADGRATGVQLTDGATVGADRIVIANGGWAGQLARTAGAALPARPTRRHLFVTAADDSIDPDSPIIWDDVQGFYARPETGGLLICLSDQDDCEPDACAPDPMFWRVMERKLATCFPHLAGVPRAEGWAAMRTLAENDTPIVGPDPMVPGLFWAAALGGHGMSISLALGRVAAEAILGTTQDPELLARLAPDHPEREYQPIRNW